MTFRQRWNKVWDLNSPAYYGIIVILGGILALVCLVVGVIMAFAADLWFVLPLVAAALIFGPIYMVK